MNIQQIKYFLELAGELHFWNTSEKVNITQSALSRQIKSLENELGLQLFERNKRNVKLTAAGEFLRTEFTKILTDTDNATHRARQMSAGEFGTLRVGHPASITFSVLPKILKALAEKYPWLYVQMFEVDAMDVDESLLANRIDIAFNRELPKSKELTSKMLLTENFALVVPKDHKFADATAVNIADLADERFVLPALNGKSEHAAQLRAMFADAGFAPHVHFESDFGATLLGLVAKGLGLSIMPSSYSHYLPEEIRFIEIPATSSLYATWRKGDSNKILENFLGAVESVIN